MAEAARMPEKDGSGKVAGCRRTQRSSPSEKDVPRLMEKESGMGVHRGRGHAWGCVVREFREKGRAGLRLPGLREVCAQVEGGGGCGGAVGASRRRWTTR